MIWNREQVKALMDRTLAMSKAEGTVLNFNGGERGNVRFARNTVTTSGASDGYNLAVTVQFGKKSGTATTNQFDEASLERTVRNAEEIARLSPDNPELMPLIEPSEFGAGRGFFDDVANVTPAWRAEAVGEALTLSKARNVVTAGFVQTASNVQAIGTSKGVFGYYTFTAADYNLTSRTPDSTGSGWASRSFNELKRLDPKQIATTAIEKAHRSRNPSAIEPGKYTVVLEPAAVADLLAYFVFFGDARSADEGRSFFSKKGGGNRIGEQVLNERVVIYSDPAHPIAPAAPFDGQGLANRRIQWVDKGVLESLIYSRFWAEKQGKPAMPQPANLVMEGGSASMADLIKSTERGILVTRFWYIRVLDPQTLLLTGLTRDGLFLIEKGEVTRPIKNMRWNESPVFAMNNIEAMTPAERVVSGEGFGEGGLAIVCPAAKIAEFTFSSGSDAI